MQNNNNMYNLNITILMVTLFAVCSCGKKGDSPAPVEDPYKEQKERTYATIQGSWTYSRLEIKSIWKCAGNTGCTVLNPDGTIKDTTRTNYDLINSYWRFVGDVISCKNTKVVGYSFDNKKYKVAGDGFVLQPINGEDYKILLMTEHKMILFQKLIGPNDGSVYYEYYFTHYLDR